MSSARSHVSLRMALVVAMVAGLTAIISPTPALALNDPDHVSDSLNGCKSDVLQSDYIPNPFVGATQPKTAYICTDAAYGGGNLGKGWNELDLVPFRLTESAGNAAPATQTYATAVALDAEDSGHPGFDVLTIPTLNTTLSDSSCILSSGNQITKTPGFGGTDVTIARVLTITQDSSTNCVIDFDGRLAVGAHLFPGSSLHANTADQNLTNTGQDRSIPVKEIAPQSISKTMTASQGSDVTWTLHKSPTPASVDLGDTCATGNGSPTADVSVQVSWTKNAANPNGPVTITAVVSATNPSHRTIQVTVVDKIYTGGTVGSGTLLDTVTLGPKNIAANTTAEVGTHTFVWNSPTGTQVNDVATGSYVDLDTGVPVPGTTTTSAVATIQNNGPVLNNSAVIQDSESITGTGLQFAVNSTSGASGSLTTGDYASNGGTAYVLGTKTVGPVYFESSSQTATGSVTFNKTIYFTGPGDVTGSLADTANLNGSDGFTTSANASIGITAHTEAVLTITKNTSVAPNTDTTFSFTVTGPNNFSAPVSVTVEAGKTSGTNTLGGLADGSYNVHENAPPSPWKADADQPFTVAAGKCTASVAFNDTFGSASAKASKVTVPAGNEQGWVLTLSGPGVNEAKTTDASGNVTFVSKLDSEGTYTITETVKPLWDNTAITGDLSGDSNRVSVNALGPSCSVTIDYPGDADAVFNCVFTNTKEGNIIIKKVTDPATDSTTSFDFTASYGTGSFSLKNGESNDSGTLKPGDYSVSETTPTGWDLTKKSCDNGDDPWNIHLGAGVTVTCAFINTQRGAIIVKKVTNPAGGTGFTFTGDAVGTIDDGGQITVPNLVPGTYTSTESAKTGWDLTSIVCDDSDSTGSGSTATFMLQAGETVTCTFTNTQRGHVKVIKTVNGQAPTGNQSFTFTLRTGADTQNLGTILETTTADASNGGTINFTTNLVPGDHYQLCEDVMPGWNTTLDNNLFVPGSLLTPTLPNPNVNNMTVCTDFTVQPGETKTFTVDNTPPPGGRALTIGFWKNWASCANSKGGQKPVLDQTLLIAAGDAAHGFVVSATSVGTGWPNFAPTYYLILGSGDCQKAVNLLNKSTADGKKKMASDPLFNMTAQLIGAQLNYFAGAGVNGPTTSNITKAVLLDGKYKFDGNTYSPKLSAADAALANCLATQLDNYNNDRPVSAC